MADLQKDGYLLNYTDAINLDSNEIVSNLELEQAEDITQIGVEGKVVDVDGNGIEGATVKLFDNDFNPIIHTVTDEYGSYLFTNVETGEYLIYAVKQNYYLSEKAQITVTDQILNQPNIILTKLPTGKTAIYYGVVKDKDSTRIGNVIVNMYLGDELKYSTMSADDGEFIIYGIEEGTYIIEAYNDSYKTTGIIQVEFIPDIVFNTDITVTKYATVLQGTINGVVTSKLNKTPIENAFVGLYLIEEGVETLVSSTFTDNEGRYFFGDMPAGQYIVKAKSINT